LTKDIPNWHKQLTPGIRNLFRKNQPQNTQKSTGVFELLWLIN